MVMLVIACVTMTVIELISIIVNMMMTLHIHRKMSAILANCNKEIRTHKTYSNHLINTM